MRSYRVYCDRCGKEDYLRNDAGRATSDIQYNRLPSDWTLIHNKEICPECARQIHLIIEEFLLNATPKKEKQDA